MVNYPISIYVNKNKRKSIFWYILVILDFYKDVLCLYQNIARMSMPWNLIYN